MHCLVLKHEELNSRIHARGPLHVRSTGHVETDEIDVGPPFPSASFPGQFSRTEMAGNVLTVRHSPNFLHSSNCVPSSNCVNVLLCVHVLFSYI